MLSWEPSPGSLTLYDTWGDVIPRCHRKPGVRGKQSRVIQTWAHVTLTTHVMSSQKIAPQAGCSLPCPHFLPPPTLDWILGFPCTDPQNWRNLSDERQNVFKQAKMSSHFLLNTSRLRWPRWLRTFTDIFFKTQLVFAHLSNLHLNLPTWS